MDSGGGVTGLILRPGKLGAVRVDFSILAWTEMDADAFPCWACRRVRRSTSMVAVWRPTGQEVGVFESPRARYG
jgi:hypothetical protein